MHLFFVLIKFIDCINKQLRTIHFKDDSNGIIQIAKFRLL